MSDDGDAQKPLFGAVVCGTALRHDQRDKVGPIAHDLGAVYKLDLTADVTHLLVGSVDSEKYRHTARHRPDIQVVQPAWLFAVRDAWTADEHIDLNRLYQAHRLPTFHSLSICVTGFEDATQRQWLQKTCGEQGAEYHGDLTKKVTHLVAAKPTGAKYERARQWKIKVVSLKWFTACVERGMILDEACYDPILSEDAQGRSAFVPQVRRQSLGKRDRGGDQPWQSSNAKRRLRRTASTRLNSQSQSMLDGMADPGIERLSALDDSWAASVNEPERAPTPAVGTHAAARPSIQSDASLAPARAREGQRPLFAGWTCLTHGHDESVKTKLSRILTDNGATVTEDLEVLLGADREWSALILPSAWIARTTLGIPKVPDDLRVATEWWVERCVHSRKALNPDKDVFSRSMHDLPEDLLKGYVITSSGFGSDVRFISKVATALGGRYNEDTDRNINLLIYKTSSDLEKPTYCVRRGIDVVGPEWLFRTLLRGEREHEHQHSLSRETCEAVQHIINMQIKAEAGDEGGSESQNGVKKRPSQRLSETRKKTTTPALPMMRSLSTVQNIRSQPIAKPQPLDEVDTNSQGRARSQPEPVAEINKQTPPPSPKPSDKENQVLVNESDPCQGRQTAAQERPLTRQSIEDMTAQANEFLSCMLARRQNSSRMVVEPRTRRKGPLGRASSTNSSSSFVRTNSGPFYQDTAGQGEGDGAAPQPSQLLSYEAPVAEDHKRYLAKTMGMKFEGEMAGKKIETAGVMQDAESLRPGHGHRPRASRSREQR